ncbi:hypothetical protein AKJ09_05786 [Labilithrix luteola]|uniref:Uncharacterized protein n=1 Tax=Labilithrix luteola TaxID=1391654 RepID=A0A0K1Q051_9BACT|nr:hypothetical protein AKJ09_05786 [Labilithrix luteola]
MSGRRVAPGVSPRALRAGIDIIDAGHDKNRWAGASSLR